MTNEQMTKDERRKTNNATIALSNYRTIALTSHIRQNAHRPGAVVG